MTGRARARARTKTTTTAPATTRRRFDDLDSRLSLQLTTSSISYLATTFPSMLSSEYHCSLRYGRRRGRVTLLQHILWPVHHLGAAWSKRSWSSHFLRCIPYFHASFMDLRSSAMVLSRCRAVQGYGFSSGGLSLEIGTSDGIFSQGDIYHIHSSINI